MKLVSLFNPVSLEQDPSVYDEGDLYYNTASNVYRINSGGNWISLVDQNNARTITSNNIIEYGDDSTQNISVILNESFDNNTLYIRSSSVSYVIIENDADYPIRSGAEIKIVKAGEGNLEIISASPSISIYAPSSIYATAQWDCLTLLKINDATWLIEGEFRDLY